MDSIFDDFNIPTIEYKNYSFRIEAPEGTFYIIILEDIQSHKPVRIMAYCGKSGASIGAWIDAFCRIVSKQLERELITLGEIASELSNTTSDKSRTKDGITITSGPEAIFTAIMKYQAIKYTEQLEDMGYGRGPSIGRAD